MKKICIIMLLMASAFAPVAAQRTNDGFSVRLLKSAIGTYGGDNVVVSPLSVSSALTIAANGAKGQTLSEMMMALQAPEGNVDALARYYAELFNYLPKADTCTNIRIANAVWIDDSFKMKDSYRTSVERLGATVGVLDLQNPKNAAVVNDWAAKNTNNLIKNVISGDAFVPDFRMLIANALYFKGKWESSFSADRTRKEKFIPADGSAYEVPMMHKTANFRYTRAGEKEALQVLCMDYRGGAYEMIAVLPPDEMPADMALDMITEQKLSEWSNSSRRKVEVSFPKFKIRWANNLNNCLQSLGIRQAFTNQARFGGMSDDEALKISQVNHFTCIEVDESGTEAAAVTTVMMNKCTAMPRPEQIEVFRADHPFFVFIREKESGAILFSALIGKP